MFKAMGRGASKNILQATVDFYNSHPDENDNFRLFLALTLRPVISSVQGMAENEKQKNDLFWIINMLPMTVQRNEAAELCQQHLAQASRLKSMMGETAGFHVQKFMSGFFRLIFQIPDFGKALQKAAFGRTSKELSLLENYLNLIQNVYNDKEHLLLTDEVEKLAINSGLGF